MSSYTFDKEAQDEIDFWRDEAEHFRNEMEIAHAECFDAHTQLSKLSEKTDRLRDYLETIIELNTLQVPLHVIDEALDNAAEYIRKNFNG